MVTEERPVAASRKQKALIRFGIIAASIIGLNIIFANLFFRIDLTADKRYTITPATEQLLENLTDEITVDVYLEGDFPARFKRFQNAIRENLKEFQIHSNNITYNFIDPSTSTDREKREKYYLQLAQKGLHPTNLFATEGDKKVEKIIFPGAIVSGKGKEVAVMLLKGNQAASPDEKLNQSIEGIEFELASAIRQISRAQKKRIGYIEGHGELSTLETADLITSFQKNYEVYRVDLNKVSDLKALDAIIIAKPLLQYTEPEKYKIDQFIVNGGKAMFLIDPVNIALDSIRTQGTVALPLELNLQDLLFNYGVRLNGDLVQDLNSGQIPMVTGMLGNQPQTQLMNWRYYPLLNSFSNHPITRNLDALYAKFVSTIDTVKAPGIKKSPLITTSPYTRVMNMPATINLNEARIPADPRLYTAGPQAVGYLLEGRFRSVFRNRPIPKGITNPGFVVQGKPSKIVVVSDGDLVRNEINKKNLQPYRLGFDRFSGATFANKDFVSNAMDYLLNEGNLISVRFKEIKLRPLDRVRAAEEKTTWQFINLVLPLLLLASFGAFRFYRRKRKYQGHFK